MFKAILVNKDDQGYRAELAQVDESSLPEGDVRVKVLYSTLNYKDGLAITGKGPVVRSFPMVPGIDFAGEVLESSSPDFKVGDMVLLNGWGVGEGHWGGLAQQAQVKADWLIPLPKGLTAKQALAIGTAGYTAMLCVMALEKHGTKPSDGEVLVTGAAGGVGSIAIALLSKLGFKVVASTGRMAEAEYLKKLGAAEVIDRASLSAPGKPLAKERWAAVVDSVGSHTLANACAQTKSDGAVAACGLAQGMDFPSTVAPFILRGVTLYGINSVTVPRGKRIAAYEQLSKLLDLKTLDEISHEISLADSIEYAQKLMAGNVRGRLIVDVNR
ncbi:MDR family oxidoreductase [Polynucleobacter paneuropaeus]|jgi:acrylyl-CoA reductase (NADPH)|uniref:Oxidoreductase n=1 Tax=Polynucleobacter paneuropaeus TaxID=2527775 RepID=A0A2Z4JPB6_9BURK|nr:MDR family oxidoreductase [Polynucleobacter paneuropaeus]AWW45117.1 oxidoreductase [Polynucleobacter paneuropaeus]AWW46916.1 oxidoreductase [Polynucleobacter paneuropaeus]AWW48652.1 oxidoreductase [Polynucleobacter paneuropaeus]AWW50487.1 oxidoreductase [Polynucleobacter paneuropaeus]MBT8516897.1 oxidoreductase [Polynucleobacter paneuropaeus]